MSRYRPTSLLPATCLLAACLAAGLVVASPAAADIDRPQLLAEIRSHLDAGQWRDAAKAVAKAEKKFLEKDKVRFSDRTDFAELALYRAVAAVHLDEPEEAEWFWYLSHALDLAVSRRDVSQWGRAQAFIDSIEVRGVGRLPADAEDPFTRFYEKDFQQPEPPVLSAPGSMDRSHRVWDSEPVRVELYLDAEGRPSEPRLIGRSAHPMLVYTLFEDYFERKWTPARFQGEPVGALFESRQATGRHNRWDY